MRLIDIDASIESVKNLIANGGSVEQALDAQPTVYDVDKVVEQLQEAENRCRNKAIYCEERDKIRSADRFYARQSAYMDAAQIVRKGGVEMFIPYRCEECEYGEYLPQDSCWDAGCHATTDEECEQKFEKDEVQ